jgi:CheY-like chemotaxis protein
LNAVLGFSQLMLSDRQDAPTKQQRDRLAQMQTAGRHLLDLINDVLDLAGVESVAPTSAARRVLLSSAVRESMQWVTALADERHVELACEEIDGTVIADRRRVRQILTNLLSNAVKYNRPGGSVVIVSLRRLHDGQEQCGIVVRDTGIGMTTAQVAQLFQPFNRLGAESSSVEGTGIGLTIVRQIVHRMGGHVDVDSKPRMGSAFTVWLPAAPEETSPVAFDPTAPMPLLGIDASADSAREAPLRVLCIEDNPVNLLLVKELFSLRPGVELITAANGAEGISVARHHLPHLVLLDMQLPDMHGLDVLKRLRDEPLLDKTRFVALSANAMEQDVAQALGAGFEDYWTKPIDFGKFLAGIDAIAASRH